MGRIQKALHFKSTFSSFFYLSGGIKALQTTMSVSNKMICLCAATSGEGQVNTC